MFTLCLVFNVFGFFYCCSAVRLNGTEKSLFLTLLESYDAISRPVLNASTPVIVQFGIALNQILDLDEKKEVLSTSVWIYEEWDDANLIWSPDHYDGLDTLMIPSPHLWVPDIFIFNTAGEDLGGFVNVTGSKIMVKSNGRVKWLIPLIVKSSCSVDVTYFPYDKQSCTVRFGSWIYDGSQVDIYAFPLEPDIEEYMVNSEFDLLNVSMDRTVANNSCCPGDGKHPMINLHLSIKRKSLYYDFIVIAPTIMLCVLTLATFLLPTHCGEKIAIGLTVFLTLYVLQLLIAENVPDTNTTPILGIFLFLVMTLNSVSLILATIVMNVKKRANRRPVPRVPRKALWFCKHILSKLTIVRLNDWKHPIKHCDDDSDDATVKSVDVDVNDNASIEINLSSDDETQKVFSSANSESENDSEDTANIQKSPTQYVSFKKSTRPKHYGSVSFKRLRRQRLSYKKAMQKDMLRREGCRKQIENDSNFYKRKLDMSDIVDRMHEWYFVAEVMDKASFFIYVVCVSVTILTVLVIVPYTMA
ncbi:hypothetical protein ScPMuIL_018249 [Solemya velum]